MQKHPVLPSLHQSDEKLAAAQCNSALVARRPHASDFRNSLHPDNKWSHTWPPVRAQRVILNLVFVGLKKGDIVIPVTLISCREMDRKMNERVLVPFTLCLSLSAKLPSCLLYNADMKVTVSFSSNSGQESKWSDLLSLIASVIYFHVQCVEGEHLLHYCTSYRLQQPLVLGQGTAHFPANVNDIWLRWPVRQLWLKFSRQDMKSFTDSWSKAIFFLPNSFFFLHT